MHRSPPAARPAAAVRRAWALVALGAAMNTALPARAEADDTTRREVAAILLRIAESGCEFYRAGSWYAGADARVHLERKFHYLVARKKIGSAEDFVALAATSSSMTGEAYAVRCKGVPAQPSAVWLGAELRALRAARPAPR